MRLDYDRFVDLVGRMNDVAIGHGEWTGLLDEIGATFGSPTVAIDLIDKRTGEVRLISTRVMGEAEVREYDEHVHKVNPRYSLLPVSGVGQIRGDRHIAPEVDATGGEYYDWLGRAAATRYFMGAILFDDADYMALTSAHFTASQGIPGPAEEEAFARILPCMANALKVQRALASRARPSELLDEEALGSDRAYALIDGDGRMLDCSAAFERIVARSGAITLHERRIGAVLASSQARLSRLLSEALSGDGAVSPAPARIERPPGGQGLLLRAVRLARGRELFARMKPAALLVLVDLDAPGANTAEALRVGWHLTEREAELATLIGNGLSIEQAAARLGIRELTARHHLKGIYRRLEIERQSDLVRLVTRIGG